MKVAAAVCLLLAVAAAAPVRILTWDGRPVILQGLDLGAQAYHVAHPEAEFEITGEADIPTLFQRLVADLAKPYAERDFDAYFVTLGWISDIAGQVSDLTSRIATSAEVNFFDIPPFFQQVSSLNGKVLSLILDGDQHLVYYRRDLFEAAGMDPPTTWEEYVSAASSFSTSGDVEYGSCFTKTLGGIQYNMFFSMLASFVQSKGTDQGIFFDSCTMTPNFNNPAAIRALDLWQQTHALGPHSADRDEKVGYGLTQQREDFLGGKCALTIDWGDVGAYSWTNEIPTQVAGKTGTIALPGSTKVLVDGALVDCDATTCPFAVNGVNRAPFGANGGGHGLFIAKDAPADVQQTAYNLGSFMSTSEHSTLQVHTGNSGFDPYRTSHLDAAKWILSGMPPQDAVLYINAFRDSISNPNFALDLRIPGTSAYQNAVSAGLSALLNDGITPAQAAQMIQDSLVQITADAGIAAQLAAYRAMLGASNTCAPLAGGDQYFQ